MCWELNITWTAVLHMQNADCVGREQEVLIHNNVLRLSH